MYTLFEGKWCPRTSVVEAYGAGEQDDPSLLEVAMLPQPGATGAYRSSTSAYIGRDSVRVASE